MTSRGRTCSWMATGWSSNARSNTTAASPAGLVCKQSIATALRRYSYRFTSAQIGVLADLYATALEQLEPEAVPAVRKHMCDPTSEEAQRDAAAALAVCERLSSDS